MLKMFSTFSLILNEQNKFLKQIMYNIHVKELVRQYVDV
jgi:hypothetical protein